MLPRKAVSDILGRTHDAMKRDFSFDEAARPAAMLTAHRLFRFFFSLRGFFRHTLPLAFSWLVCSAGAWGLWQWGVRWGAPFLKTLSVGLGVFVAVTLLLVLHTLVRPLLRARPRRGDPAPVRVEATMDEEDGFTFRTPDGLVRRYRWRDLDKAEIFRRTVFLLWTDRTCMAVPRRALGREGVRLLRDKAPSPAPPSSSRNAKPRT